MGARCEDLGYDFSVPSEGLRLMLWHTAQRVSYRVSGVQGRDRQGASHGKLCGVSPGPVCALSKVMGARVRNA